MKEMERRKLLPTSVKLVYIFIVSLVFISCTQARYRKEINGSFIGDVAAISFKVNEVSSSGSITVDLGQHADPSNIVSTDKHVVAPGTKGSFNMVVDATGTEMPIEYELALSSGDGDNLPDKLSFYYIENGENIPYTIAPITGSYTVAEIQSNPIRTYEIYWAWEVDESINESQYEGQTIQLTFTSTGKQETN